MNPETKKPTSMEEAPKAGVDLASAQAAEAQVVVAAESQKANTIAAAMEAATVLAADDTAGNPVNGKAAWDAVAA